MLLASCARHPPAAPPDAAFTRAAWSAHLVERYEYLDHSGHGSDLSAPDHIVERMTEECSPTVLPSGAPELGLSDPVACTHTREGALVQTTLRGTHRIGAVYVGRKPASGAWQFHTPRIAVPETFGLGDRWAARHDAGEQPQLRRCDAVATPFCDDGVALACVTLQIHHVTWTRNHWCPAEGHVGHEGLVAQVGTAPHWSWSSEPRRDGRPLTDLPLSQRPTPDPRVLMRMAHGLTPARLAELSPDDAHLPASRHAAPLNQDEP